MSTQSRIYVAVAALWAASLFAVGASAQAPAQVREYRALPEPRVLTSPDVGFRVEGMYGDVPTGVVVLASTASGLRRVLAGTRN